MDSLGPAQRPGPRVRPGRGEPADETTEAFIDAVAAHHPRTRLGPNIGLISGGDQTAVARPEVMTECGGRIGGCGCGPAAW
jgi:hypothetical protein